MFGMLSTYANCIKMNKNDAADATYCHMKEWSIKILPFWINGERASRFRLTPFAFLIWKLLPPVF